MKITQLQMKKVLTTSISFSQLGFNMLITRLSGLYKKEPSQQVLQHCTEEANKFLEKYEFIMKNDYEKIINL